MSELALQVRVVVEEQDACGDVSFLRDEGQDHGGAVMEKSYQFGSQGQQQSSGKVRPVRQWKAGGLVVAVWPHVSQDNHAFHTVSFEKRYKSAKDGSWQSTQSLSERDIPRLLFLLGKAYEFLVLKESPDQHDDQPQGS